ncbi:MAG: hypothetical protein OXI71_07065 [Gemmatimonadota bacterium]|nr:hypothetical protein [Gemmatimonadota bacterium]MDE2678144.1 hypothetical protein [Gemmatimonadota bacterium]
MRSPGIRPAARLLLATALLPGLQPVSGAAQQSGVSGYYLNLWTHVGSSPFSGPSNGSAFQRMRLMWDGSAGPALLDLAYEHALTFRKPGTLGAQLFTAATGSGSGGDWLSLHGEIDAGEGVLWRHRIDRLSLHFDLGPNADLVVGRQPISWATTLVLTPADPFSPFDPADPFREYRIGVDAARLRYYAGAFTQFELVARPALAGPRGERTLSLLARSTTNYRGWDLGAWTGTVHDTFGAAAFLTGAVGLWAVRTEVVMRRLDDRNALRGSAGLDRTFSLQGREMYVLVEYQHDQLGAPSPNQLVSVATSRAFAQGEMQALGRDVGALQLSCQLHPLLSASNLFLASLRDGSFLLAPGLGYSATESVGVRVGAFLGVGRDAALEGLTPRLGSEFGAIPPVLFLSTNFFF